MSLEPGFRLGPYEILSPLGAGGMGEVYRARDQKLDRDVAVKVLPSHLTEDAEVLSRFEREARAAAVLSHPGILAIHDFGRAGEAVFRTGSGSASTRTGAEDTRSGRSDPTAAASSRSRTTARDRPVDHLHEDGHRG